MKSEQPYREELLDEKRFVLPERQARRKLRLAQEALWFPCGPS
jgi:hypothetical protein